MLGLAHNMSFRLRILMYVDQISRPVSADIVQSYSTSLALWALSWLDVMDKRGHAKRLRKSSPG
jgi:hypothetical protein